MRLPLRRQIMLPMAAIMLLTVVVLGGLGATLSVRAAKANITARIDGVTQLLEGSNFPLTDTVLSQMKSLSGAEMAVVDTEGQVISTSGGGADLAQMIAAAPRPEGKAFRLGERRWQPHAGYFHTVVPLSQRRNGDQSATLHIFYPEADYRSAWQHALVPSILFTAVALPVVMLLAGTTASRISQRMSRLQGQVDRIAQGDFQQLELNDRDDEIRALGQAVNHMAVMLARYEDDVRRTERMRTLAHLGGGIAHQLRNSATGCAIALDLHAEECPVGTDCESLRVAKRQLQLMEEYIQRFLHLGKTTEHLEGKALDLAQLIDELLPLVQPAARHANVAIEWQRPENAPIITGDTATLSQLLMNLLINAIEASEQETFERKEPGRVIIALTPITDTQVVLMVSDTGAGPPDHLGDDVFEPFVTAKTDGVGLGLSVAADVARRHGGRINWQRRDGMTRFTVELPCKYEELQRA